MARILITDDDQSIRETLAMFLQGLGHETIEARHGREALRLFGDRHPELTLLDIRMPGMDGMEVLDQIRKIEPSHPVILVSALDDMHDIVLGIQQGAFEYLEKPVDLDQLERVVRTALESRSASMTTVPIAPEDPRVTSQVGLIGKTHVMRQIFKQIGLVSRTRVSILIQGESGTGKELIARVIHQAGCTKGEPFIAINCSAIPESLVESELFGHARGSFTDAVRDRKGKFELAGVGTIFLDEIADLSLNVQSKLLRVIQQREFEPVGAEYGIPMKARLVAASNQNLEELVERKKFREDLFFRLNVFRIDIPPLRDRKDDIPALVLHFLHRSNRETGKNVTKVAYDVVEMLQAHDWTGNVRELENAILQAVVLCNGDLLEKGHFRLRAQQKISQPGIGREESRLSLAQMEKQHILMVLEENNWSRVKCAAILGISRQTLAAKIRDYGLTKQAPESTS